jgi:hypothetical protein
MTGGTISVPPASPAAVASATGVAKGVMVIHGIDRQDDFKSAGKSDLDPSLPAEATDPPLWSAPPLTQMPYPSRPRETALSRGVLTIRAQLPVVANAPGRAVGEAREGRHACGSR